MYLRKAHTHIHQCPLYHMAVNELYTSCDVSNGVK